MICCCDHQEAIGEHLEFPTAIFGIDGTYFHELRLISVNNY